MLILTQRKPQGVGAVQPDASGKPGIFGPFFSQMVLRTPMWPENSRIHHLKLFNKCDRGKVFFFFFFFNVSVTLHGME